MKDPRGSIWRKWDLHFHTPASYDYKNKSITNQEVIDDLVASNISVVAITDHHFIDVERIEELQRLGKGKITILPGIEFLGESRGREPIHYIAIFSEISDIIHIWDTIRMGTSIVKIKRDGKNENEVYCDILETAKIIKELGGIITIHAGSKTNSLDNITNSLPHTMAQKQDIAEVVDIFELGKLEDVDGYSTIVIPHLEQLLKKKHSLIICSDNHNIKEYTRKTNLWIKADPCFEGLKQAILQPERIFLGEIPEELYNQKQVPHKFIQKLSLEKVANSTLTEEWFDGLEIEFNRGLVAIIGNKGNAKSAVSDIIGFCGHTNNHHNFSFLNPDRFYENKGRLAKEFNATMLWADGSSETLNLFDQTSLSKPESVRYIPQNHLEQICTNNNSDKFDEELKEIIFSHLPEEHRFEKKSLDELLDYITQVSNESIETIQSKLKVLNKKIIEQEKQLSPSYSEKLKFDIGEKQKEKEEYLKLQPTKVEKPQITENPTQTTDEIESIRTTIIKNREKLAEYNKKVTGNFSKIEILKQRKQKLENLGTYINGQKVEMLSDLAGILDDTTGILEYSINVDKIQKASDSLIRENESLKGHSLPDSSINSIIDFNIKKLTELQDSLDLPIKQYQKYLDDLEKWQKGLAEILGEDSKVGSLKHLIKELDYVENGDLRKNIDMLKKEREALVLEIFQKKQDIIELYKSLYTPVSEYIQGNEAALTNYQVSFNAALKEFNFSNRFLEMIHSGRAGYFRAGNSGADKIIDMLAEDITTETGIVSFINNILDNLTFEEVGGIKNYRGIENQIKDTVSSEELVEYVCGLDYLKPEYGLQLDSQDVKVLSPGQRGALLLIFYLMLDKSNIPLIIDQPEENLDNQSVFKLLVTFIKIAKKRRQVIIVTHNPNLAVGCDADQIVYIKMNKANKNKVSVSTGAIENVETTKQIVEILEGTFPAFDIRANTYLKHIG